MATRRVSNRYPRPGQRIAPQTLHELLLDPIPERFRGKSADAGLKLCDLDETVWKRFPAEVVVELSAVVVERVAGHSLGKIFQHRHFPRPSEGTRLEDLALENRTRRCLAREGFEDHPETLGDHTVGEIMAIRSFGPRCLVDLLSALESSGLTVGRPGSGLADKMEWSVELTSAARRLEKLPGAGSARSDDPRFARLIEAVDVEARTALELARRLLARSQDPPDPAYATEQVRQLEKQLAGMSDLTMEEELIRIFGSTPYERNREILIGYYGWEDGRQHTLTEIGKRFGITRERIRQVCAKLTKRRQDQPAVLAPVMDRALALVSRRLVCPAVRIEAELARHGLTAVGMQLDSVATGARLLGRSVDFRIVKVEGSQPEASRLAVDPRQVDAAVAVVDLAKKEVYFHGLATVATIERAVSEKFPGCAGSRLVPETLQLIAGFSWLDRREGWFRLRQISKHGLPKTIGKILAVAGELAVSQMRTAMGRNRRLWKEPPPEHVLLEFCRQTPDVRVEGNRIIADPPRDWKKSLTGVEAQLVATLKKHGEVLERGALEDLCVSAGMNRFSFHAFVSWSPVIAQYGHSVYGLLGAKVSRKQIDALRAARRAKRTAHRVLYSHGRTEDGKVWLNYRLSKAASTYAVITVPAALKDVVHGRFDLIAPDGSKIGTLATKDGRAWGLGAFLRRRGARINDRIVLTLDLQARTAEISWSNDPD